MCVCHLFACLLTLVVFILLDSSPIWHSLRYFNSIKKLRLVFYLQNSVCVNRNNPTSMFSTLFPICCWTTIWPSQVVSLRFHGTEWFSILLTLTHFLNVFRHLAGGNGSVKSNGKKYRERPAGSTLVARPKTGPLVANVISRSALSISQSVNRNRILCEDKFKNMVAKQT